MESRAYAWAAGLFTLLLGAGVVLAVLWFSGDTYERVTYVIESTHPVTGLNPQSTVRLRGVSIGNVESVEFAPANARLILIRIGVRTGTPITRGTVAQLRPQGITGLAYIMLDESGAGAEPLPPGDEARIPMRPAFTEELAESARGLLVDARQVMGRLDRLLSDDNVAQMRRMLANAETLTDRMARVASALEPAARAAPALVQQMQRTLAEAEPLIADARTLTRELARRVDIVDRIGDSAQQVGVAAQSVSQAVTDDTLPRLNVLVDELTRTTASLDRLLLQLREQPSSVVFGAPRQPPGPGERGYTAAGGSR